MNKWPKQNYESMVEFYGNIGENQARLDLPYSLKLAWDQNIVIKKITCNEKIHKSLYTIFENTLKAYGLKEIQKLKLDNFGGCLNVRKMRGGTNWSIHSWGAAVDLDPDRNALRMTDKQAVFARPEYNDFWKIVQAEGWVSLGKVRNFDWMHFQAAVL
jgi:hypothetical protein